MKNTTTLKPDAVLKDYWRNNERFADLFNQVFFQGEDSIDPGKLCDKDTEESAVLMEQEKITSISRTRDVIKQYADGVEFVLIGLESQMKVHYAMPVRSMLYDSLRYTRQCKELEQAHRKEKDLKNPDEFLSGMKKNDRIKPVITLVVYYGEERWDGPINLSDMMDIPPQFQKFFLDRSIYLLEMRDIGKFEFKNQDNHDFFTMIQEFYKNDGKEGIDALKKKYPDMKIYWETLAAIGVVTGSGKLIEFALENKGGRLDMCATLEKWEKEVETRGEKRMATLMKLLIKEGRSEDLERALEDSEYRGELYEEFHV